MFNPYSQAKFQVGQSPDLQPTTLPPLQPKNCLHRSELRAARERHNSGSLAPSTTPPAPNDQSDQRAEPPSADERLLPAAAWTAADMGRSNYQNREDNALVMGERAEILADLWDKENLLDRKLAEVERTRKTAEDRHQKEIAARSTIERRATKLEKRVSDLDDALKSAEKRLQRETNARNSMEKHVSRIEKKLASVEESLNGSEKRHRESNGRSMIERRITELEKKFSEVASAHKATEDICRKETDIRNAIGDNLADLQMRVTSMDSALKSTEERYQRVVECGVMANKRAAELGFEVQDLQGQLMTEKTAVDVEKDNVQQLKAELANTNYRLEREAALLRSERSKTKMLADREADRLNSSSEERVRIAQEKLTVLSNALSEERQKSKKLKDALAGVQTELNNFKRKAGNNDVARGPQCEFETPGKGVEHGGIQTPADQRVRDQPGGAHLTVSPGQDLAKDMTVDKADNRKLPYSNVHRVSQHSTCALRPDAEVFRISKQKSTSRSADAPHECLAQGLQSSSQLQDVSNQEAISAGPSKTVEHSKNDQLRSRNGNRVSGCQNANDGSAEGQPPLAAKKIISDEECFAQEKAPIALTEARVSNFQPGVEGQSTTSMKSLQYVSTAPEEDPASEPCDTPKNVTLSEEVASAPRYAPPQRCRALQRFSETPGLSAPRNIGHPIHQKYVPPHFFMPGSHRARPWDLDHPDNFAPRQHISFTEPPFPLQFAPAQIASTSEGYNAPQLLAQPHPVDNPQKNPLSKRHVATATRSLHTADVSGLSRTQK